MNSPLTNKETALTHALVSPMREKNRTAVIVLGCVHGKRRDGVDVGRPVAAFSDRLWEKKMGERRHATGNWEGVEVDDVAPLPDRAIARSRDWLSGKKRNVTSLYSSS